MSENKQEILERVLLLMKYDNRTTLSENIKILYEQTGSMVQPELTPAVKSETFKPKMKVYNGFFGKLQLPETAIVKFYPEGLIIQSDGKDNNGNFVYWDRMSKKYGLPSDYSFQDTSNREIKLTPKTKIYTPDENYMSQYKGKVSRFTIPKGTLVPKFNKTGWFDDEYDKWVEEPLENDVEFKIVVNITIQKDIYYAIYPDPKKPMRGFTFNQGYFFLDPENNKYVSYVPKTWIEFRSPTKVFWDNYGLWIEIAGSIVITVLTAGTLGPALAAYLGTEVAGTTLITDAILNGIFNLGIARFHFANDDSKSGTLSLVIAFLPLLLRVNKGIASLFRFSDNEIVVYCNEIIESLEKNFSKLGNDGAEWQKWYDSLSDGAKEVINGTQKMTSSQVDEGMKEVIRTVNDVILKLPTKTILQRIFSKGTVKVISKFVAEFAIVGAEIHMIMKLIESVVGELSPQEQVIILSYLAEVSENNGQKLTPQQYADEFLLLDPNQQREILDSANKIDPSVIHEITINLQKSDTIGWSKIEVPDSVYWNSKNFDEKGNPTPDLIKRYPAIKNEK
jgi:hypothetical protein